MEEIRRQDRKVLGPEGANRDLLFSLMAIEGTTVVDRHTRGDGF